MEKWNRTAWIKTIVIVLLAIPNVFVSLPRQPDFNLALCLGAFLLGGIIMYISTHYNLFILDRELTEPIWNDSPVSRTTPLAFFQFLSWLILASGIALIAGTAIHYKTLSSIGLIAFSFGFGLILGTYLVSRKKRNLP